MYGYTAHTYVHVVGTYMYVRMYQYTLIFLLQNWLCVKYVHLRWYCCTWHCGVDYHRHINHIPGNTRMRIHKSHIYVCTYAARGLWHGHLATELSTPYVCGLFHCLVQHTPITCVPSSTSAKNKPSSHTPLKRIPKACTYPLKQVFTVPPLYVCTYAPSLQPARVLWSWTRSQGHWQGRLWQAPWHTPRCHYREKGGVCPHKQHITSHITRQHQYRLHSVRCCLSCLICTIRVRHVLSRGWPSLVGLHASLHCSLFVCQAMLSIRTSQLWES